MKRVLLPTLVTDASLTRRGSGSKQHVGFPQGAGGGRTAQCWEKQGSGIAFLFWAEWGEGYFYKTNKPTNQKTTECSQACRLPQVRVSLSLLCAWKRPGDQDLGMVWTQKDAVGNGELQGTALRELGTQLLQLQRLLGL